VCRSQAETEVTKEEERGESKEVKTEIIAGNRSGGV
jgi:hypothetical protein